MNEIVQEIRLLSVQAFMEVLRLHSLWLNNEREGKRADLRNVDLRHIHLAGFVFDRCDLRGADLRDADLPYIRFFRTDFQGADLRGANLRRSNFLAVNFRNANLQGTNFFGADFLRTDFRGANCCSNIQKANRLDSTSWLHSDVPWWLGHRDQDKINLYAE